MEKIEKLLKMARKVNDKINDFENSIVSNLVKIDKLEEKLAELNLKLENIKGKYIKTLQAYTSSKEIQERELSTLLRNDKEAKKILDEIEKIKKEIKNTIFINKQLEVNIRYKKEVLELLKLEIKNLICKND